MLVNKRSCGRVSASDTQTTCTLPITLRTITVKKTIAILIAGLFATAAFAQSPTTAATTATPTAVKTEAKQTKVDAKQDKDVANANADAKEAKADATAAKASAKVAKASAKHAKHNTKHKHVAKAKTAKETKDAPVAAAPASAIK